MKRNREEWQDGEECEQSGAPPDGGKGLEAGWDGEWPPDLGPEELWWNIDRDFDGAQENEAEREPGLEDRIDRELEARADLTPQQMAGIDLLHALFPRGFVFCTPEMHDRSQVPEEQRNHILYTHDNIERMWGALYGHFERGSQGPADSDPDADPDADPEGV